MGGGAGASARRPATRGAVFFARIVVVMTGKQPDQRKEIGDVAMGYDADAGSAGIVRTRRVTFDQPGQELALEGGGTLAPFTIAYETYGTLSERARTTPSSSRTPSRATPTWPASRAPRTSAPAGGT